MMHELWETLTFVFYVYNKISTYEIEQFIKNYHDWISSPYLQLKPYKTQLVCDCDTVF